MSGISSLLAIDPGPEQSAFVLYEAGKPIVFGKHANDEIHENVVCATASNRDTMLVIEQIAAMGMSVGSEVFETVFWSGRFAEAWEWKSRKTTWDRMKRHEVKMYLCGNMRAKDANIRQALLDRFGPGKEKAVGTKKNPGPLHGVSGDVWQALALAVCYWDTRIEPIERGE